MSIPPFSNLPGYVSSFAVWASNRKNDTLQTSYKYLVSLFGKEDVRLLKKWIDTNTDIASYNVKSKGFVWKYSLKSIGKVLLMEQSSFEPLDRELVIDAMYDRSLNAEKFDGSIESIKVNLAKSLGLRPEQIEFTIKG